MSGVYLATYSQVDVYESTVNEMPLMRRCSDNWVNATQILKIAGFAKAQRTRLLEREVHQFEHQKIQGGHGRFQGTWVPLEFAQQLAQSHKVPQKDVSVLYYDPATDGPVGKKLNPKATFNSHSAEAKKRRIKNDPANSPKLKKSSPTDSVSRGKSAKNQKSSMSGPPTFASTATSHSKTPNTNIIPAPQYSLSSPQGPYINRSVSHQFYPPAPFPMTNQITMQQQRELFIAQQQQQLAHFQQQQQEQAIHIHQQQQRELQLHQQSHPPQFQPQQPQQAHIQRFSHNYNNFGSLSTTDGSQDDLRLNRTNSDTSTSSGDLDSEMKQAPHISEMSFAQQPQGQALQQLQSQQQLTQNYILPNGSDMPPPQSLESSFQQEKESSENGDYDYYTEKLLSFFSNDNDPIPDFVINSPSDFDINKAIDSEGHTPLHWASALASANIIETLISKNANPLILNAAGMNCLSKLIHFTNSYDIKNFSMILHLLRQCLIVPDKRSRTPLHYLMENASVPNKFNSLNYYFTEIVKFIAYQQREAEKLMSTSKQEKNLLRILINHQDKDGNTALHLALKSGENIFVKELLKLGADVSTIGMENIPYDVLRDISDDNELQMAVNSANQLLNSAEIPQPQCSIDDLHFYQIQHPSQQRQLQGHQRLSSTQDPPVVTLSKVDEAPETMDVTENKENIFDDQSSKTEQAKSIGLETPLLHDIEASEAEVNIEIEDDKKDVTVVVKEEPKTALNLKDSMALTESLRHFKESFPDILGMLRDSFDSELSSKNDEIEHNETTYKKLESEINALDVKNKKLMREIFGDEISKGVDIVPFMERLLADPTKLETQNGKYQHFCGKDELRSELVNKLRHYKHQFYAKRNHLTNLYERSQALDLAKLVHNEETHITDEAPEAEYEEMNSDGVKTMIPKNFRLAVKLTSLQVTRRVLVEDITTTVGGPVSALAERDDKNDEVDELETLEDEYSAGGVDDSEDADIDSVLGSRKKSLSSMTKEEVEERRTEAKLYLYKKLVSNICSLPMEEIDGELLNGIEMRLVEGKGI